MKPSGKAWHLQTFPKKPVRCSLDKSDEKKWKCELSVRVDQGWQLATEVEAIVEGKALVGHVPNPAYGFVETIVRRAQGCVPTRWIEYYPPGGVATKTGIAVTSFLGFGCLHQSDGKFTADYTVTGRRLIDKTGKERAGAGCEVVGKVTCDTYPAKLLRDADFQDQRPERFDLWVQVQTASMREPQNFSKTFTMGTSREKLVFDGGIEIWIEETNGSYALKASGPGSLRRERAYIDFFNAQMRVPAVGKVADVKRLDMKKVHMMK